MYNCLYISKIVVMRISYIKQELGRGIMKTIGLIGGMSWESSLEYYRILNETVKLRLGGLNSAKCLLDSVNFYEIEKLQHEDKWEELTELMINSARRLKNGGVDFIVICTNTMHIMAEAIEKSVGLKVLHIADVTGQQIVNKSIAKVGLLGTKFTMEGSFYRDLLKDKYKIEVIIPEENERQAVHKIIYEELCKGNINETSKELYKRIINNLSLKGAEGVILGCTEIPLLIKQEDVAVPVFNTTEIHAVSAVDFALED